MLITEKGMPVSEVPAGCRILILSELTETLSGQPTSNPESGVTPTTLLTFSILQDQLGNRAAFCFAHSGLVNYTTATPPNVRNRAERSNDSILFD